MGRTYGTVRLMMPVLLLLLIFLVTLDRVMCNEMDLDQNSSNNSTSSNPNTNNVTSKANGIRIQRQLVLQRNAWKKVFDEIRLSKFPIPGKNAFNSTKTSYENAKRFDGFQSWEKRLAQWKEDVEIYLDQALLAGGGVVLDDTTNEAKVIAHEGKEDTMPALESDPKTNGQISTLTFQPRPVELGEAVVPATDISDRTKHIWIVTTAALPWMTGTAVNPLLRAAYFCEAGYERITLMLPWLERSKDQEKLYGRVDRFPTREDQDSYIRSWLRETARLPTAAEKLNIEWYIGWQETLENSVYAMGDITALIPDEEADICILEEPEHLNWYRAPGESWTKKFQHVVGIVHTNYFVYASEQPAAFIRAPAMKILCSWMCRAHCNRVIKLSATLSQFAPEKELVQNVHGVRREFLEIGTDLKERLTIGTDPVFAADAKPSVYFIGKMLWSKGIGSLMELVKYAEESAGLQLESFDMYGGGPDKEEAEAKANKLGLKMTFHGPVDHASLGSSHKIFINPSLSEVLCTTVAEALAMGKFVILPSHPSNDFFTQFPNCLPYSSKEEFVGNLYYALTHSPVPMTPELTYILSWEAAIARLVSAGSISVAEAEAWEEALTSEQPEVEIPLPPIVLDDKRAKQIVRPIYRTRERYRNFRSRLIAEVKQTKVLPLKFQKEIIDRLDKQLDLNLDEILSSPKMRLQLSPAELDRRLLEFYDSMSKSPSGDILRIIGGGANVGAQNRYLKRQAKEQQKNKQKTESSIFNGGAFFPGDVHFDILESDESSPVTMVQKALRRNFRSNSVKEKTKEFIDTELELESVASSASTSSKLEACIPMNRKFKPYGAAFAVPMKYGWCRQEKIRNGSLLRAMPPKICHHGYTKFEGLSSVLL